MPLLALLTAAALSVPASYQVQDTQKRGPDTVILAAYVSPDAVGHSLLLMRDGAGKTRWKQYLGWKYRIDEASKPGEVSVTTLLPGGSATNLTQTLDAATGKRLGVFRWIRAVPTK